MNDRSESSSHLRCFHRALTCLSTLFRFALPPLSKVTSIRTALSISLRRLVSPPSNISVILRASNRGLRRSDSRSGFMSLLSFIGLFILFAVVKEEDSGRTHSAAQRGVERARRSTLCTEEGKEGGQSTANQSRRTRNEIGVWSTNRDERLNSVLSQRGR